MTNRTINHANGRGLGYFYSHSNLRALLLLGTVLSAAPAYAQVASPSASSTEEITDSIVVTASRAGSEGFNSPNPTTVVSSEFLTRQNATTIAEALNEFPAFKATVSPASNGARPTNPGVAPADLRGVGPQRTLVLVNGVRLIPQASLSATTAVPSPDLNQIPMIMIDRVEVVTGGASAQWGSDAVAGVVNILLKNEFEGLEATVQGGTSQRGDFNELRLGALGGVSFADGAGNFVAAIDYFSLGDPGDYYSRDWAREENQIVANPNQATNGLPALILSPNVHDARARGGNITGPATFPLRGMQFLPGGVLGPFDAGTLSNGVFQIGGQGRVSADGALLSPSYHRINPYARVSFNISDAISVSLEGSYPMFKADIIGFNPRDNNLTIRADNGFLPDTVRTALATSNLTSFTMSRNSYDIGPTLQTVTNEAPRIVAGVEGSFGDTWEWNAFYSWGRNKFVSNLENDRLRQNFAFALDSVRSGSQVVCRATLPGPSFNALAAGCVPINIFGDGSPSPASLDYITDEHDGTSVYRQDNVGLNLRGELFSTWAGPVSIGTGFEYRTESQVVVTDAIAAVNGWQILNGAGFSGDFDVKEGYFEVIVPLARGSAFAESLDINAAVRFADYSSAGSQTTWKLGATYEPFNGLRLRASRSRDIRAPAITELNSPGSATNSTLTVLGQTRPVLSNTTIGNPNLLPEKADTLSLGVVIEPLIGFSASVDYFKISIDDAITSIPSQNVASLCNLGQVAFCNLFTFNAAGAAISLLAPITNAGFVETEGVDVALSYRAGVPQWFSDQPHSLSVSLSGTYVFHSLIDLGTGNGAIDRAGENGQTNLASIPHLRANLTASYTAGPGTLTAQVLYVGAGTLDNVYNTTPANTINDNSVPAITYLDLSYLHELNNNITVFGTISNVLDQDPPPVPHNNVLIPANGIYYDIVGRAFKLGVTARF